MSKSETPLKRGTRIIPEGKKQVNLNVNTQQLEKLKAIALKEGYSFSEIYNLAFERFISSYEKKHGEINFKKGQGLDKL